MALIGNGSMLVTISQDSIMLVSSVDVLVKGIPITQRPHIEMPPVYLMRNADLVAMDDRITELKNQVGAYTVGLLCISLNLCNRICSPRTANPVTYHCCCNV